MLTMAFNQEKALVGAFSVIVQLCRLIVNSTTARPGRGRARAGAGARAERGLHGEGGE